MKKRDIGCNRTTSAFIGGLNSSFDGEFKDELVWVESGLGSIVKITIGDISEAEKMLKETIQKAQCKNQESIVNSIYQVITKYFGDYSNIKSRMSFYPDEDELEDGFERGKVSDLKNKNAAMCVERAMLAQNLLKTVGLNSFYKTSGIIKNGTPEIHAYNLVQIEDKYYLFDATIPTIKEGLISPLICEIPFDVFNQISRPENSIGYAIAISHFNPLANKDYDLIYDSGHQDKIYNANEITKKRV